MFQEHSSRSNYWFDIDIEWAEVNFSIENPSFTIDCFKETLKFNMNRNILHLLFLLETKKKHMKLNTILNLHWWNIIKTIQIVVASVV